MTLSNVSANLIGHTGRHSGAVPCALFSPLSRLSLRDSLPLKARYTWAYYLSPIRGQTVGVVFQGKAAFSFAPSVPAEQVELQRFAGSPALNDSITESPRRRAT